MLNIAITGAAGRMGCSLIEACRDHAGLRLAVALERPGSGAIGRDAGEFRPKKRPRVQRKLENPWSLLRLPTEGPHGTVVNEVLKGRADVRVNACQ